jgi:hypothetical protein
MRLHRYLGADDVITRVITQRSNRPVPGPHTSQEENAANESPDPLARGR